MRKTTKPPTKPRRAAAPAVKAEAAASPAPSKSPIVVGIGASAGGLEALQVFLEAMPADTGLAFVHVQHLDPQHKSLMVDLLRRSTRMNVCEAQDGAVIEPNCVYINPPDRDVAIAHGKLRVIAPP